ncbi:MAG: hypothetical protein ACE5E4_11590 [Candidatus Binatia bacterium]
MCIRPVNYLATQRLTFFVQHLFLLAAEVGRYLYSAGVVNPSAVQAEAGPDPARAADGSGTKIAKLAATIAGGGARQVFLEPHHLLYVFVSRPNLEPILHLPRWGKGLALTDHRLYGRTSSGLYHLSVRSLIELSRSLDSNWTFANQAVLVNLAQVRWADLGAHTKKLLGFDPPGAESIGEGVVVTREYVGTVKAKLGMLNRRC